MSGFVRIENLVRRFGDVTAVDDVSLSIERGEILALLGPSGSGKTTILRLLAGFERPDQGRITVDDEDVTRTPPAARRFGMVFQSYALFPHLDVFGNVAFGLESIGLKGEQLEQRVSNALASVELAGYDRRKIGELSGGQQQRVALARALAPEPRVLLLDEPLSNLDPTLREKTRFELREVIHRAGITTVIVTHEQDEAFDIGDRVAVLHDGRLEQTGTPAELYEDPHNAFVAGFVGRASVLNGRVTGGEGDRIHVAIENASWDLPARCATTRSGPVLLLVRPEAFRFSTESGAGISGAVTRKRYTGAQAFFRVETDGGLKIEVSAAPDAATVGSRVGLLPAERGIHVFPAEPQ